MVTLLSCLFAPKAHEKKTAQNSEHLNSLSLELWKKVFCYLNSNDCNRFSLVCKKWDHLQLTYHISMIKKINGLRNSIEDACFIPANTYWNIYAYKTFHCSLLDSGKVVVGNTKDPKFHPDFKIKAKIKVINIPFADDALEKKVITFFKEFRWVDYACIIFEEIHSLKILSEEVSKRREIETLAKATNSYLQFLSTLE
jgi:F-box domain